MYYPGSENKGADQLRSYCEANLRLCFRLCRLLVFPWGGSNTLSLPPPFLKKKKMNETLKIEEKKNKNKKKQNKKKKNLKNKYTIGFMNQSLSNKIFSYPVHIKNITEIKVE